MAKYLVLFSLTGEATKFETHELIESGDLTAIAERAGAISYRPIGE